MKHSKQFDFDIPMTATEYRRPVCIGTLKVSGTCYKKDGEVWYDIDSLTFTDRNDATTPVPIEAAQWFSGGEYPDNVHEAVQQHCEDLMREYTQAA